MQVHGFILADDDIDWVKLIPFVVVGVVWILGILSAIAKKASRGKSTTIVPPAPLAPRKANAPAPMRPLRKSPAKAPRPTGRPGTLAKTRTDAMFASRQADAIRQMLSVVPPTARPQRREPVPPKRRQAAAATPAPTRSDIAPASSAKPVSLVDGRSLARRMQPALLRYQYILTEVMRPPLALRDEDDTA